MKTQFRFLVALALIGLLSACASTPVELNREAFQQQKIALVNLASVEQPLAIQPSLSGSSGGAAAGGLIGGLIGVAIDSGINAKRRDDLAPLILNLKDFDLNEFLQTSLSQSMNGEAFADQVTLKAGIAKVNKKRTQIPHLLPSAIMSPNFGVINIALTNQMYQLEPSGRPYRKVYSSSQLVDDNQIEVSKENNKQYWLDNPEQLQLKIELGFSEALDQFVNDYNGIDETTTPEANTSAKLAESTEVTTETPITEGVEAESPTNLEDPTAEILPATE